MARATVGGGGQGDLGLGAGTGPRNAVEAWVDGSYLQQGTRAGAGWGLVVAREGRIVHEASGSDIPREHYRHRNVAGEVVAVVRLLEWAEAEGLERVTVHYDYSGLEMWATRRWKTNTELTKGYQARVLGSSVRITWSKVLGHSGVAGNERADELARAAAQVALEGERKG